MATTDQTSPITYSKHPQKTPRIFYASLKQNFEDGSSAEASVPQFKPSYGTQFLLEQTYPDFIAAAQDTLFYDGADCFSHFPEVLDSTSRRRFEALAHEVPQRERSMNRFYETVYKFLQHLTGDENFHTAFLSYLLGEQDDKPKKPGKMAPVSHRLKMDDLINAYNQIPTVQDLTEEQERTIHFRSYPIHYQDKYREVHLMIQPIPALTSHMENLYQVERRQQRARKGAAKHRRFKRSASDMSSSSSSEDSDGSGDSYRHDDEDQDQSKNKRRKVGKSGSNSRNKQGNQPRSYYNQPCPIHCQTMDRNHRNWHTWGPNLNGTGGCNLNPRSPNYIAHPSGSTSSQKHKDAHYADPHNDALFNEQTQASRGNEPRDGSTEVGMQRRTTTSSDRHGSSNDWQKDEHYFDLIGHPLLS